MDNPLHLHIDGVLQAQQDLSLSNWPAEVYAVDGLARGTTDQAAPPPLADDDVLELELANGVRILVAAADAGLYLGHGDARGGASGNQLQVGQLLHFSAVRPPPGAARDGLGAWILRGLRIYRKGPAGMTALIAAGTYQDAQLEDRLGLYHFTGQGLELAKVDAVADSPEPSLIFLHGTASSTAGSFGDLLNNPGYRHQLEQHYGPRRYAFEHRSLTDGPIANALELVKTLPVGARLHLVSHSRGGLVGELLARANRVDREPFTAEDIDHFLAHGKRSGRPGHGEDAVRLAELNRELVKRAIRVERFVRVACPARGTTLASGRLDRWASVMLNLLGKGFDAAGNLLPGAVPVAAGYGLLKNFLLAVVKQRTDARILPGLEAMMPDSPLVALLNSPDVTLTQPLHILAGDFEGDGLLPWLGDCLSEVFYGGETDLVVNTPSMSGGASRLGGIRQMALRGPQVTHFSYFQRSESAQALVAALGGDDGPFALLDGPSRVEISRGGKKIKARDNAPIVYLLPGIMGSHLQHGRNRIWFDPLSMWLGRMARLKVGSRDSAGKISTDGWMDRNYEKLARYLADSHEVRPFAYDWRLSLTAAGERLGAELDRAMADARQRGQALRIVAHSMGGLVARLALKDRWDQFKAIPGSRLLQLGTPNQGSHSIAAVLMARDDFVQTIERWFDWKHDTREFLTIVRDFPGVLELLPWPEDNGLASDGVDYFDPELWQRWYQQDREPNKAKCWAPPLKGPLADARAAITALRRAGVDPECSLYVTGRAPTPSAVRLVDGVVEIGWSDEGDGRVPWRTGIPPGVPVWYTDAAHGDLANHDKAFAAYRQLLETGDSRDPSLTRTPPLSRGLSLPLFRPRGLAGNGLYPSVDEVLAAATGGSRPPVGRGGAAPTPATIEVIHGSLASAEPPVLIGAYAHDGLRGSAAFVDGLLGGQLTRTHQLGRYPMQPDDALVFRNPSPGAKPGGAIVVGLGALGELLPGTLTQALTNGLLEYVRSCEQRPADQRGDTHQLAVATLLVGTGFTGLSLEVGVRCLLDALRRANEALAKTGAASRIAHLSLYEETEERAVAAVQAVRDLVADPRFAASARCDGRLRSGAGGYRGRCIASGGQHGTYRMHIVEGDEGGLCFTVIGDRARNEVALEANQRQAVDGLLASVTRATQDQPGLSRALFELLVPNAMKETIAEVRTLMMSVDRRAGAYPWELMRDSDSGDEDPLATRIELIRQLASSHGRGRVPTVTEPRVFIVGDTESGMAPLPGAVAEARVVEQAFAGGGYQVVIHTSATAQQVFEALFYARYRVIHLAGHGVVGDPATGLTGMVLGPGTLLTAAQVNQLRHVPEFVFINCCHLGDLTAEQPRPWGELAANLATQFIEMGCKAVIAAGWAVDDGAANTFARTFYAAMLKGERFGQAVRRARTATYSNHRHSNTWGAFQAYGDERYRFPREDGARPAPAGGYIHPSHLVADLDMHCARLQSASQGEKDNYYRPQIEATELAASGPDLHSARVREKLACAWGELGEMARAIDHYRAALAMEDGGLSLKALEQLANLESRHGARLVAGGGDRRRGDQLMKSGLDRLNLLLKIAATGERLALVGSHWKRRAQALHAGGDTRGVDACLGKMRDAYWCAAEHGHGRTGDWDYYPLFNALDGDILVAARGDGKLDQGRRQQLPALLQAGIANARRRYGESRVFFHALAEIDARRLDALWACLDGRPGGALTNPEVVDALASAYLELCRRLGTVREQDSAANHLQFLLAMLPPQGRAAALRDALGRLAASIGRGGPH